MAGVAQTVIGVLHGGCITKFWLLFLSYYMVLGLSTGAISSGYILASWAISLGYILTFSWAISSSYILEAEDSCEFFI